MSRYRITESVGSRVEDVGSFRDLEKHHPSSGRESGRNYETIDGELEEVRRTSDGRTLVKKDFILSQDSPGPVYVPSPAAGYIHYLGDATNAVRIYDRPFGEPGARLLAQSLHMERGNSPPEGARVEYGQRLGQMGDTGSPGSFHAHVEMEPAQFRRYVADITSGVITPDSYPTRGSDGPVPVSVSALADGVLKEGDRGPEVTALQQQLNQQGFRDAQGRVLATDGDFGRSTEQAVQALQRARGLEADGVVGRDTTAALRAPPQQTATTQPSMIAAQYGPTTLSNLIGSGEGGYNSYNRGRAGDADGKEIDFSQMTLAEIMRRQDLPRNDPDRLFAVGKFQIIPGTMEETVTALRLDRNQKLTPELQERMFSDYLVDEKRPAVNAYITGESSGPEGLRRAQTALAQEFASVADPRTGRSFYDGDNAGNSASITPQQAGLALEQMRTQYQANIARGLSSDAAYRGLSGEASAQAPQPQIQSQGPAAATLLATGTRGPEVVQLQEALGRFGYLDSQGRALAKDGDFGPRTQQAVQAYQQAHGLKSDGVVGPQTLEALAKSKEAPLLSDPRHPDNALYQQAVKGMEQLGPQAFKNRQELENAAGATVFEAKASGLTRIDHVVQSSNGTGLFAVQGAPNDPAHHRVHLDKAQAAAEPMEKSTVQVQQEILSQQPQVQQQERERRSMVA
ncbi:hypothetical protein CSC74_12630 [Pseudoxanthomonas yeongjuensis]|uniref:peptidoglycan-binding protein n=1 Tax=Pseudoxanthomonas yeongjuensis TaxID=377616 RepID=UPI001392073A|nr:peptidoglycan-binding protein [Pseudoxanthomonas yeongjuensis]KAF1716007.1 hypothetical protein CSC74_12630 [Pseudoxanthomonas yeongjuensis]